MRQSNAFEDELNNVIDRLTELGASTREVRRDLLLSMTRLSDDLHAGHFYDKRDGVAAFRIVVGKYRLASGLDARLALIYTKEDGGLLAWPRIEHVEVEG
ncbi:MAG: hypothetical protein KF857_04415 [Fimbriimonadaceae bacterium]|nr:hypothetical protein [Fimbriimonadaceae bacterium]